MGEIMIEKIKSRIKENLHNAKEENLTKGFNVSTETAKPVLASKSDKSLNSVLWKYGTKYSRVIKSIPILNIIAERYYWKLFYHCHTNMSDNRVSWHPDRKGSDLMNNDWHFHNNLKEMKNEGLKGKIKLFIFKLIGFFAFWQEQKNKALYHAITNLRAELAEKDKSIENMNKSLSAISRTEDALYQDLTNLRAELAEKDKSIRELLQLNMEKLLSKITEREADVNNIKEDFHSMLNQNMNALHSEIQDLKEIIIKKPQLFNDLNRNINFISRKIELLSYELKKRAEIDINQSIKEIANKDFSPESYTYFAFENTFRGSRDTIKKRQLEYLHHIKTAYQKSKGSYHLDLGCGRGEFLEILYENNIPAKGVDINEENIIICSEFALNAELTDALSYLKTVKNNSLIGITAFQVVEHLNTEYLIELIKASFQKIKDGGVLILETVNPYSLYSLRNFFLDLTHRNPIPCDTLKFLVEASGFINVEVKFSSPVSDEIKLEGDDENTRKLNKILFGFQDFAIIGWK